MKSKGSKGRARHPRFLWAIAVLTLVVNAAACGGGGAGEPSGTTGTGGGPESDTLTIVAAPPEFDALVDAIWYQKLEEAGITVKTIDFEFGPDTIRAIVSGNGDIASNSPTPTMRFIQEAGGGILTIIAASQLNTDYVLLTTPDISSTADLVGKKIGISEPGDISDSTTRLLLDSLPDLKISQVDLVGIGGSSERIAALAAGEISAAPVHAADALSAAEAAGLKPLLNYWEYIPVYAQKFIAADSTWLKENPNLAQLAIDTLIDAQREAQDNEQAYIALSKEIVPDMPDQIREQVYRDFADNGFFAVNGGLEAIQPTIEADQSIGNLAGPVPDVAWLDTSFVENYLQRNGEYQTPSP